MRSLAARSRRFGGTGRAGVVTVIVGLAVGAAMAAGSAAHPAVRAHAAGLPAPHRKPPDLIFHHGQTQLPLRIIAFAQSTFANAAKLAEIPEAIVHSDWLTHVELGFGVPMHPAAIAHGFVVNNMPAFPKHDASTSAVLDNWVEHEFRLHGIRTALPSFQTIVIIFQRCTPPQALDGFICVGHHPKFLGAGHGPIDSYALSLNPRTGSPTTKLQHSSAVASHEVAEAISDTHGGWFLHNTDPNHPSAFPPPAPNPHDPQGGCWRCRERQPLRAGRRRQQHRGGGPDGRQPLLPDIHAAPPRAAPLRLRAARDQFRQRPSRRSGSAADPAGVLQRHDQERLVLSAGPRSKSVTVTGWTNSTNPQFSWTPSPTSKRGRLAQTQSNFRAPDSCHVSAPHHLTNGAHFKLTVSAVPGQANTIAGASFS